jgi:hypothetical protein
MTHQFGRLVQGYAHVQAVEEEQRARYKGGRPPPEIIGDHAQPESTNYFPDACDSKYLRKKRVNRLRKEGFWCYIRGHNERRRTAWIWRLITRGQLEVR